MKAKEVLKLLRISRPTLTKYIQKGWIKATLQPTGLYFYDDKSVYDFLNNGVERKTIIYGRVSTNNQKKDLENQIELLKQFCFSSGYKLSGVYKDICSGIDFEHRKDLFLLLEEIMSNRVEKVIISYRDRLSRIGFSFFKKLFSEFGTEIIVMSEVSNSKLESEEIFEEIVSLIHSFSTKLYSKRRGKTIEVSEEKDAVS